MGKEHYIIQMEINMKMNELMIKEKEMENISGNMVDIIQDNLKMD